MGENNGHIIPNSINNYEVELIDYLEAYRKIKTGVNFISFKDLDKIFNPLCYSENYYTTDDLQLLYKLPKSTSPYIVSYFYEKNGISNKIEYIEFNYLEEKTIYHHLFLPKSLMEKLSFLQSKVRNDENILCIIHLSNMIIEIIDNNVYYQILDYKDVIINRIFQTSCWHVVNFQNGLPQSSFDKPNGCDGKDRYLWLQQKSNTNKSNGYVGNACYVYYSPKHYGQNIICALEPSSPSLYWLKRNAK
jgi:hypothetical protein